eukprot:69997_1
MYDKIKRKLYKYPPGFNGIPICGTLFYFHLFPKHFLFNLGILGPISMTKIGYYNNVFINDAQLLKQLFIDKRFHNRLKIRFGNDVVPKKDAPFMFLSGETWKKRRKYSMKTIFTLTSSAFILNKVNDTITNGINKHITSDALWYPSDSTCLFSFNNVFSSIFRMNLELDHPFVTQFIHLNELFFKNLQTHIGLSLLCPPLLNIPQFILNRIVDTQYYIQQMINLLVDFMNNNGFKVNLDSNVLERIKIKHNMDAKEIINKELVYIDLVINEHKNNNITAKEVILDMLSLMQAGIDTTQQTAEYGFLLLAKYPNIQQRVYNELINEYEDGIFSFIKLHKLNVFRAFIYEMLRVCTPTPTSVPHFTNEVINFIFEGKEYNIPANSLCYINNYFIHKHSHKWDGKYLYENSIDCVNDEFHFDYWLNDNNQFVINENFCLFGKGRDCAGQALAIRALYAIFGVMILKYKFIWDNNNKKSKIIQKPHGSVEVIKPKIGIYVENR